jgi:LysM repeat protein
MGDEQQGYNPNQDERDIYADEEQNPDEYYSDQGDEQASYDYADAQAAPVTARDRIAAQRQQMRHVTTPLTARDRGSQRRLIGIITVICLLVVVAGLAWLILNGKTSPNSTNTTTGYVAPTPTNAISAGNITSPTQEAGLPPAVVTAQVINGNTPVSNDNSPNVDATARPDQQATLPPGVPTSAAGQPTALPAAVATVAPGGTGGANPPPGNNPASVQKYTVNGGDTMASISAQFNVNVGQLMAANNDAIKNPTDLQAGQNLNIPSPDYSPPNVQWRVGPGENLYGIIAALQATDTNPAKIAAANPCQPPAQGVCDGGGTIFPGETITIPFH